MTHLGDTGAIHLIVKSVERSTPLRGCPLHSPEDPWIGHRKQSSTPPGRRTDCLTGMCDTLAGSYISLGVLIPTVIGTSCLDIWAKKR